MHMHIDGSVLRPPLICLLAHCGNIVFGRRGERRKDKKPKSGNGNQRLVHETAMESDRSRIFKMINLPWKNLGKPH